MNKDKILILWTGGVWWYIGYLLEKQWYEVTSYLKNNHKELKYILDQNKKYSVNFQYTKEISQKLFDIIIIWTKSYDVSNALNLALWWLKSKWTILVMQNGLHKYDIPAELLWSISKWLTYITSRREWNTIIKTSPFFKLITEDIKNTKLECLVKSIGWISHTNSEFNRYIREKYIHIASYSWIICSTWYPIGKILSDPLLLKKYYNLIEEIHKISLLEWYNGNITINDYIGISKATDPNAYCSLYFDLEQWKKTEFNDIIGVSYKIAKERKVSSPTLNSVYQLIKARYNL